MITSPPYLDTTNYREDQWLRLWFLGGGPLMPRGRGDDRHYNKDNYWTFIQASMQGLASLLAERARMVIRIGGRRLEIRRFRPGSACTTPRAAPGRVTARGVSTSRPSSRVTP